MTFLLHRSDSPAALADGLAELLRAEPLDVFTAEVIVVGARGVERWLTQRLSHRLGATAGEDGVSAGIEMRSPTSLAALLLDRERDDPWHADRLVWPLLDALDACLSEAGFEAVARHLGAGESVGGDDSRWEQKARRSRRYAVARRIAGLFASYARERPSLLAAWEAGLAQDGTGKALPSDLHWQPILWRACVDLMIERDLAEESPVARHRRVVDGLTTGHIALPGLPGRLSLFGHTRLAESELDLLESLSTRIDVHLWLPHPSPALWDALSTQRTIVTRVADDSASRVVHPLLASLGRDVRELERSLLARDITPALDMPGEPPAHTEPTPAGNAADKSLTPTRLQLLQTDIRYNAIPSAAPVVTPGDTSVQIHACHGPARQVEVLRELLVALLDHSQGTIQPRDIIVMCPDIETYAPLVHATFGSGYESDAEQAHPGQTIRVQMADRALSATNPLVDVAQRLIQLVAGRVEASAILDLLALPAVAKRFRLDDDALEKIGRWVAEGGVRWGIDAQHRSEYGLAGLTVNTWESGLDRLALGVAVAADSTAPACALLPLDDIGSSDVETVSALLEILEIVELSARQIRTASDTGTRGLLSVPEWLGWLRTGVLALTEVPEAERWQVAQFERELGLIGQAAGDSTTLRLTDIRVMVEQRWGARPTRSNFRTGSVTVCSMVPMRSVPHKVVIALGMDDGHYPRSPIVDGDDVLARDPLTGERDPRSEDSQLLLDAIMAAQEKFIALYSGFDERTGARKPPAVPLQELLSAASSTGGGQVTEHQPGATETSLWVAHPLQAFDEKNFTATSFIPGGTYDEHARAGASALRQAKSSVVIREPFIPTPLPERPEAAVGLDDLVAFYENPAREFLRRRLSIALPRASDELENSIPLTLNGLDKWKVGDRMLNAVVTGTPLHLAVEAERRRGQVPPGRLGEPFLREISEQVNAIVGSVQCIDTSTEDVLLDLPSGTRVRGTVSGVVPQPTDQAGARRVESLRFSTISPKHVVGAWIQLLALRATSEDTAWSSVIRGKRKSVTLSAPSTDQAVELLEQLADFRQKGLRFPLGVPPKTASAFTHHSLMHRRDSPQDTDGAVQAGLIAAELVWSGGLYPERADDVWWERIYGKNSSVHDLNSWNSLVYWAPRIWGPIHEAGGRVR